jgi:hypothetical protein
MKKIFVTEKEFIIKNALTESINQVLFKNYPVVSIEELINYIRYNAIETIKAKYLESEMIKELEQYELCKMNKKDVEKLLKYIKFV